MQKEKERERKKRDKHTENASFDKLYGLLVKTLFFFFSSNGLCSRSMDMGKVSIEAINLFRMCRNFNQSNYITNEKKEEGEKKEPCSSV